MRPASTRDRALGAFHGLAVGDAYGMPTQSMSRAQIAATYGAIDGLRDAAPDQPLAAGMSAGAVTDDTEQAVLVGRLLVDGHGRIAPRDLADALLGWEQSMRLRGSIDLLGPSSAAAISAVAAGAEPGEAGTNGTTNGAAMRITPVGIAFAPSPVYRLVDAVTEVSRVTHNTGLAISGAVAVAAVVSAGIEGGALPDSIRFGLAEAEAAAGRGRWVAGASVAERTRWALRQTPSLSDAAFADYLEHVVGTSLQTQESVVAALLIADRYAGDAAAALRCAASIGGDTDTVAAIAGAILGAHLGLGALPAGDVSTVRTVSQLDLEPLVDGLLALRDAPGPP